MSQVDNVTSRKTRRENQMLNVVDTLSTQRLCCFSRPILPSHLARLLLLACQAKKNARLIVKFPSRPAHHQNPPTQGCAASHGEDVETAKELKEPWSEDVCGYDTDEEDDGGSSSSASRLAGRHLRRSHD